MTPHNFTSGVDGQEHIHPAMYILPALFVSIFVGAIVSIYWKILCPCCYNNQNENEEDETETGTGTETIPLQEHNTAQRKDEEQSESETVSLQQNKELNEESNFVEASPIAAPAVDKHVELNETKDISPNAVQNNNPTKQLNKSEVVDSDTAQPKQAKEDKAETEKSQSRALQTEHQEDIYREQEYLYVLAYVYG